MSRKKEMDKAGKVRREKLRLSKVFKDLDKNKLATVKPLINTAAFIAVTLDELQEIINNEGYVSEYKNGANQYGKKQSEAVEIHIAMTRNLTTIIKQLTDLAPQEKRKDGRLAAFQRDSAQQINRFPA
jgi:adenine specific DNA methylase Mod